MATGKLFESIFDNVEYEEAVIVGGGIIIAYTFLGGFLAVCWTDLFQGTLMLVAVIVVPAIAYFKVGGLGGIREAMRLKEISISLIPEGSRFPLLAMQVCKVRW